MDTSDKKASWLELFYDTAFVALVAQLTYLAYQHHQEVIDLVNVFLVGYTIFIAWWATTANRNLKPTETIADKLSIQLQMIGAFLLSLTMPDVFDGQYFGFFFTLGILRLIQAGTVLKMYQSYPDTRPKTYNILQGFLIAASLWLLTAVAPFPFNYICAFSALAIDILTPLTRGRGNSTRYLNVNHLRERLGLFLVLVMGESMIVVALSNTAAGMSAVEPSVIFSGLGMMIAIWWLYFEYSDKHESTRPSNLFVFIHAHGFLFGSIILLSVGYKMAIEHVDSFLSGWFVAAGSLGVLVTLTTIRLTLREHVRSTLMRGMGYLLLGTAVIFVTRAYVSVHTLIVFLTIIFIVVAYIDYKCTNNQSLVLKK
jgi:low temperature requirement protein LtrA